MYTLVIISHFQENYGPEDLYSFSDQLNATYVQDLVSCYGDSVMTIENYFSFLSLSLSLLQLLSSSFSNPITEVLTLFESIVSGSARGDPSTPPDCCTQRLVTFVTMRLTCTFYIPWGDKLFAGTFFCDFDLKTYLACTKFCGLYVKMVQGQQILMLYSAHSCWRVQPFLHFGPIRRSIKHQYPQKMVIP